MTVTPAIILDVTATTPASTISGALTAAINAGDGIIVCAVVDRTGINVLSISDGTANVYAKADEKTTHLSVLAWYCLSTTVGVASGATFTVTLDGSASLRRLIVLKAPNSFSALSSHRIGSDSFGGARGTPSLTSNVAALDGDLAVGLFASDTGSMVWTESAGWTTISDVGITTQTSLILAYKNLTAAGNFTYAPSFTNGSGSGTDVDEVLAAFTPNAGHGGGSLMAFF